MKITFFQTGKFAVYHNGEEINTFAELDTAAEFVQAAFEDGYGDAFDIIDANTGEVLITFEDEDPSEDNDWGYNEDMGFDPYLGCYTDEC